MDTGNKIAIGIIVGLFSILISVCVCEYRLEMKKLDVMGDAINYMCEDCRPSAAALSLLNNE